MKKLKTALLVLTGLMLAGSAIAQELTLFTMPAPRKIDWSSPRSLLTSAVTNNLTFKHRSHKHAIGHVFIQLSHTGRKEMILTGSVPSPEDDSSNKVLKQGYGLGILFSDMAGRLEKTEDLQAEIVDRFESGRIAYIRFKLSEANYDRLRKFLDIYRKRGYGNNYNGLNLPREGLGAGCSAFGMAFVEVAGLLHPVWKEKWPISVRIPKTLIGGPLTGNKVSPWKVVKAGRWAKESEPHRVLSLYEPYNIYEWILAEWQKENQQKSGRVKLLKRKNAYGLEYDCTKIAPPEEPMFQGAAAEVEDDD
ncbi:MAG TPA: hypothetical protein PLM07_08960 [Candidatus Rifleibacterium sp.]|nr:hypothetical protein [Candidatus Rifleibacterium sp.]HPT46015.1 hypothetical protein [Candidatus Rifleibacterium sp.]